MLSSGKSPAFLLGLLLTIVSFAPAPPEPPPPPALIPADQVAALAGLLRRTTGPPRTVRRNLVYSTQARTNAFPVYVWSHFVLQISLI